MSKNRFYDSRLSYLSFVQNTNEKKVISDKIYPYLSKLPHRDVYHFLDAGIGDGTITSNIIKKFHALKPDSLLCITGKEISFEDVFNSLIKMPDRFIEHPKLALTLTNMKFSEIGALASANNHSKVKIKNLVLKGSNAHDFEKQLDKLELFINKNWGFDIDKNGRTAYVKPCIINIFREDQEKLIIGHLPKAKKNNVYDFILASQAYRSRSSTKAKISNVINPLSKILKQDGLLVITHSVGHDSIEKIFNIASVKSNFFPDTSKTLIAAIKDSDLFSSKGFKFSSPKKYSYNFRQIPSEIVAEMSSSSLHSKISNIFYIAQLSKEESELLQNNASKINKIKKAIVNQDTIYFNNEIFSIKKI